MEPEVAQDATINISLEKIGTSGDLEPALEVLASLKSEFDRARYYLQEYIENKNG